MLRVSLIFLETEKSIFIKYIKTMTPPTILAEEPRGSCHRGGTFTDTINYFLEKIKQQLYAIVEMYLLTRQQINNNDFCGKDSV